MLIVRWNIVLTPLIDMSVIMAAWTYVCLWLLWCLHNQNQTCTTHTYTHTCIHTHTLLSFYETRYTLAIAWCVPDFVKWQQCMCVVCACAYMCACSRVHICVCVCVCMHAAAVGFTLFLWFLCGYANCLVLYHNTIKYWLYMV